MINILNLPITLNKNDSSPIYLQLAVQLIDLIKNDKLPIDKPLPSIRKLANYLQVNNATVIAAYKHLESNDIIKAKKGSGYFINKNIPSSPPLQTNEINFASATPDPRIFPIQSFKKYLNLVLDRDQGYAFGYHESNGYAPLRESFSLYMQQHYAIHLSKDNIQIVSGAQQGIDIIGKALLNPNDTVIVEHPTYTGALAVFKSRGVKIESIPLQHDGINLIKLEEIIQTKRPKLIYLMSKFQNPTTITYSKKKIKEILRLANKYDLYIVEDDSMAELCYSGSLHQSTFLSFDDNQRVIYIKSFSKLLMPGLRLGFLATPSHLSELMIVAKHHSDISSSSLIQRTVDLYFREGEWDYHIKKLHDIYKKRYQLMLKELTLLEEYGIEFQEPNGGLHFWIKLPNTISYEVFYNLCHSHSLLIMSGDVFTPYSDDSFNQYIRLSFASCNEEEIKQGTKILNTVFRLLLQEKRLNPLPLL